MFSRQIEVVKGEFIWYIDRYENTKTHCFALKQQHVLMVYYNT